MTCKALKNRADYDILDSLDIDELIAMKERKKYLDMHPYAVWQGKDGVYWYTTLPDKTKERGVRQIKRKSKRDLEDAIIEYWKNAAEYKTVGDVFHEWNDNRLELHKIVEATYIVANYTYRRHFDDIGNKPIDEMKPIDWSDFLEHEIVRYNLTKDTYVNLKSVVSGLLKWAYRRQYITYSVSAVNDLLDISPKSYRNNHKDDSEEVFSEEETPRIIEYLITHQTLENLGLLLMFVTGIRVGELTTLKHGDFVDNTVRVRRTRTAAINEFGKITRKVKDTPKSLAGIRDIIVPSEYKWLVDHFANGDPDSYVFITKKGNLYRSDTFCSYLRKVCDELEIPYRSPHKIRKTYTSILLNSGVDTKFILEQVGHSEISCTENYYHKNRRSAEKKAEIIDNIEDFKGNIP